MQKKVLGVVFLLLFVGVGFFLYRLLHQNGEVTVEVAKYESPKKQEIKQETSEKVWIKEKR